MSVRKKQCVLQILVSRAEDLPGQWVAHCLNLDVISQGDSLETALESICEAVGMVVHADIENGVDPLTRNKAPDEYWLRWASVMKSGQPVDSLDPDEVDQLVTQVRVTRDLHPALDRECHEEPLQLLPEAWQIASLQRLRDSGPYSRRH